jgi:hypothetical protein
MLHTHRAFMGGGPWGSHSMRHNNSHMEAVVRGTRTRMHNAHTLPPPPRLLLCPCPRSVMRGTRTRIHKAHTLPPLPLAHHHLLYPCPRSVVRGKRTRMHNAHTLPHHLLLRPCPCPCPSPVAAPWTPGYGPPGACAGRAPGTGLAWQGALGLTRGLGAPHPPRPHRGSPRPLHWHLRWHWRCPRTQVRGWALPRPPNRAHPHPAVGAAACPCRTRAASFSHLGAACIPQGHRQRRTKTHFPCRGRWVWGGAQATHPRHRHREAHLRPPRHRGDPLGPFRQRQAGGQRQH